MKKSKYFAGGVIVVILLLNVFLLYKFQQLKVQLATLNYQYNEISIKELRVSSMLKESMFLQQITESELLPDVQLTDSKTQKNIPITSLNKERQPVLFFRFKESHCDACTQSAIRILREIAPHFPPGGIAILAGYTNVRQFYAFATAEKMNIKVYNIADLPLHIDKQEKPWFFVLTPEGRMQNVFVPVKGDEQHTKKYLQCITNKYWHVHDEHCEHEH